VSESNTASLTISSPEAMRAFGERLGRALLSKPRRALCIGFEGDLGAGKTTLVAGVLAAAGVRGPVRSPTYTLIEPYVFEQATIHHLDLYRLVDPEEIEPLGLRDLLVPGSILLIEWPSRGGALLPTLDLEVHIHYLDGTETGRAVELRGKTALGTALLAELLA
jgi:tRNA threonylcarbamoyladenosine biosynthesis protein TsaE